MSFFRSEEAIESWLRDNRVGRGPTCTLPQLWGLSVAWYGNRLQEGSRRPQPEEIRDILSWLGLSDPLWSPQADRL